MEDFFENTFLFSGLKPDESKNILSRLCPKTETFSDGAVILSPETTHKRIGFIVNGKCIVYRRREDGSTVLLNRLYQYDSFGMLSMFSTTSSFPTTVIAKGDTSVVFLSENDSDILMECPKIAYNMLRFVVKKAIFLNEKIAQLSGKDITEKLFEYLRSQNTKNDKDTFHVNMTDASRALGCGRASLYRALHSLCEQGMIEYRDSNVKILKI